MDEARDETKSVDDAQVTRALPSREGFDSVLIVGAGSGGQILAKELQDVARWKLKPIFTPFINDRLVIDSASQSRYCRIGIRRDISK